VLDALPSAAYMTDAGGRITYYNEVAATLWGQRPELGKSKWCAAWKLHSPDGRPLAHDRCSMAMTRRERLPIHGIEAIAERPDGTTVPFISYRTPLYDVSHTLVGALNFLVDIRDRKRAEEFAQRLASIVAFSDDAIVSKNRHQQWEQRCGATLRLYGR
jgi:PAS domain S-box-containing protein